MSARIRFALLSRWGRPGLLLALGGLPFFVSCTTSEDTEPLVPAAQGAKQPEGGGNLIDESAACDRLRSAAEAAYKRVGCDAPELADCPAFVRPAGGSGCYQYSETSVSSCEQSYKDADTCQDLSLCVAVAVLDDSLATCEPLPGTSTSMGGASAGGAAAGGESAGGVPGGAGAPPQGGQPATNAGGMPAAGAGGA
jgi:hypothetical protein